MCIVTTVATFLGLLLVIVDLLGAKLLRATVILRFPVDVVNRVKLRRIRSVLEVADAGVNSFKTSGDLQSGL